MCKDYDVEFLGALPLDIAIREQADSGKPTVVADPDGTVAAIYRDIARKVAARIARQARGPHRDLPQDRHPEHTERTGPPSPSMSIKSDKWIRRMAARRTA